MNDTNKILQDIKREVEQMKPTDSMKYLNADRKHGYEWAKADFCGILLKHMEDNDEENI